VIEIFRVGEREAREYAEMSFDEVEPGGFGWSEDGADAEAAMQGEEAGMIVDVVQIVLDHEEASWGVAGGGSAQGVEDIGQSLLTTKDAAEAVGVDILEAEELLGSLESVVVPRRGGGCSPGPSRDPNAE
jgi:hypothetical protein